MIANFTPRNDLRLAQIFFAQKSMELVYSKTIDTYRARLHNPVTILKELYQVLKDFQNNKIKSFDITIDPVRKESIQALEKESELKFQQVDKKHFIVMLEKLNKLEFRPVQFAIQLVLRENSDYNSKLFELIWIEIQRINNLPQIPSPYTYNQLSMLINYLFSDLLALGYSKGYLYQLIFKLFSITSTHTFEASFDYLKSLGTREPEDYTIIFSLRTKTSKSINIQSRFKLESSDIDDLSSINEAATKFFTRTRRAAGNGKCYYLGIPCKGRDYFSVIREAKRMHGSVIDMLHLGFPTYEIETHANALVIGSLEREKTSERPSNYFIDGSFTNNQRLYDKFATKMIDVIGNDKVSNETKNKMISAVRYLRLGWEASELEQKFINFWIGLEYIFSNYDVDENTIKRMKSYFVNAHSLIYLKRNLHNMHQDILRLRISDQIPNFGDDMRYLIDTTTYDFIINAYSGTNPLLVFRAFKYKEWVDDNKPRASRITRHQENLERHLTRLYRVRNEIVHDAAIHTNIEVLTGNLRYYLTFVLNSLLEYFTNYAADIDHDGHLTIDDFFIHQSILLDSIQKRKYPLEELFNVKSISEIFS